MNKIILLLALVLSGCNNLSERCGNIDAIFSDVSDLVQKANESFEKAEKKILDVTPEVVDETNPDPAKCICKGTGIIRQGDGHTTPCPYHGKSTEVMKR
jgi:hypothetical protein